MFLRSRPFGLRQFIGRFMTGEGSGLGLAIVRTIIEDHGGYAYAENREGLSIVMEVPLEKKECADS